MKRLIRVFFIFTFGIAIHSFGLQSYAEETDGVESIRHKDSPIYISEVMANPETGENEWVELYNQSTQSAQLQNWYLDDIADGGSRGKGFSLEIGAQGYAFIDLSSAVFNNAGDDVRLLDSTGEEVEILTYSFSEKNKTWARSDLDSNTFCVQEPSKGKKNMSCVEEVPSPPEEPPSDLSPTSVPTILQEPSPTLTLVPTPTVSLKNVSTDNIYISEVMVAPESGQKEWLEIYNNNEQTVSLQNWYIDDEDEAGSAPKKFSAEIPGKGYFFYVLSSGIFNNGGDHVRLLTPTKDELERFIYDYSEKGKTWGRQSLDSNTFCVQEASPGAENTFCTETTTNDEEESTEETGSLVSSSEPKRRSSHGDTPESSSGEEPVTAVSSVKGIRSERTVSSELPRYQDTLAQGQSDRSSLAKNDNTDNLPDTNKQSISLPPLTESVTSSEIVTRVFSVLAIIAVVLFGMYHVVKYSISNYASVY